MALSIMRRFTFCAGHRLVGHEGKCRNLHGHNYVLEVFVTGREQDSIGRILDFKMLKERVNGWLDENWDHTFFFGRKTKTDWMRFARHSPIASTNSVPIRLRKTWRLTFSRRSAQRFSRAPAPRPSKSASGRARRPAPK